MSGDAIRVRLAHSGDADQIASLNAFVQDAHVRAHPNWFRPTELLELRDWFRTLLLRPEARVWIAESGRAPIGYISLLVLHRPANALVQARRWCEIDNVAVHAEYRRRGVGRSLVEAALAYARESAVTEVELTSWAFNADAHAFFKNLGFVPRSIRFGQSI